MLRFVIVLLAVSVLSACDAKKPELGTKENPIKFFFVPSVDSKLIADKSSVIKRILEEKTPYKFEIKIPTSYVAVVESFGTKRADIASLNTFGYLLAHQKYNAQALLTVQRHGAFEYKAQILAAANKDIDDLKDLNGKKFAYVDPASTAGYLMPAKLFKDRNIKPSDTVFAQRHDNVVSMIYQGQVDGGATFYSPERDGEIQDARHLVKTQYPDVEDKVKILHLTDPIPNEPVVFRAGLPQEMKDSVIQALLELIKTEEGKDAFYSLYSVTSFKKSTDKDYDKVRKILQALGRSIDDFVEKK